MRHLVTNGKLAAGLLVVLTLLFGLREWGVPVAWWLIDGLSLAVIAVLARHATRARLAFVLTGIALTIWLALAGKDWFGLAVQGLDKAAFIAAFFAALSTLRNVAETSPALRRAGSFLAAQPPGRRYAALTGGGHLFALLINYGSISLLGGLASQAARAEPDAAIREVRMRRMLLAVQRGFIASLPWSPLAFAIAITTALIPGASWAGAALPGLGSAGIIMLTGWAMDSLFKPRIGGRPSAPPPCPAGASWALMLPLFVLLAILAVLVLGLHFALGVRVVGVVMLVVPAVAILWAVMQARGGTQALCPRAARYMGHELPAYRGELVLLMMAGYIGTVGAPLLLPLIEGLGFDPRDIPPWAILAGLVWLIPLMGQIGMNPILAVTLLAPLIPDSAAIGLDASAIVVAIASGWALSGATSPFTATTLLIGSFAGVSATHVGLRWNGAYFLVTSLLLMAWVVAYGLWL